MAGTLHLLRHAKSSWDDPTLADHDRPLAPRGRRAAATIAEYLRGERITPGLVLCSSSARTRETLALISATFDDASSVPVEIERGLYGASGAELLARLQQVPGGVESVMLIGHQPGIQDLALTLAAAGAGAQLERLRKKFPTAALATLAVGSDWDQLEPGSARLAAFVKPRELER
jgi:phosphohistidine phosphatase